MGKRNIIRVIVKVEKDSPLDYALEEYLKKRAAKRKKLKEAYQERVEKQLKKIERHGL